MDRRNFLKTGSITASLFMLGCDKCTTVINEFSGTPVLRIGVVADVQYADRDPVPQYDSYYRPSLAKLEEAVDYFNAQDLDFVIQLGDFVDRDIKSYDGVFPIWNRLKADRRHVIGNHDYEAASQEELIQKFGLESSYYSFKLKNWRFIVLDTAEFSFLSHRDNPEELKKVQEMCDRLEAMGALNAKPWQGTITEKQFAWLEERLAYADKNDENVIVFAHYPVICNEPGFNMWNAEKVVECLRSHKSFKAYICGHHHGGSFATIDNDYYWTVEGMMATPDENAYALMEIYEDKIVIDGFERIKDRVLSLKDACSHD